MNALASTLERDPLSLFMPQATVSERQLRQRLLNARTIAASRAVSCKLDEARSLYWMVNNVASTWAFAPASEDDLKDIADGLARLFMTASTFERIGGGE